MMKLLNKLSPQLKFHKKTFHKSILKVKRRTEEESFYQLGRIYIIPNWPGLLFFFTIVVVILLGAIYSNNLVNLLGYILISLFAISMVVTHLNIRKIKLNAIEVNNNYVNEKILVKLQVKTKNENKYDIGFKLISSHFLSDPKLIEQITDNIQNITFEIKANKRGKYSLTHLRVYTTYPFGIFYCWRDYYFNFIFYAYPARLSFQNSLNKDLILDESDFSHLDHYKLGDSIQKIDWKSLARGRPLQIKKFESDTQHQFTMDWNNIPFNDLELKLSFCADVLAKAIENKHNFILKHYKSNVMRINNPHLQHQLLKEFSTITDADLTKITTEKS